MYSANTPQVNLLVKNVLSVINQEKVHNIKMATQSEAAFLTNEDREGFYRSYEIKYEEHRVSHNHRKVATVYCATRFRNTLVTHLLSDSPLTKTPNNSPQGHKNALSHLPEHA